jgi:hypothetical protein
VRIGLLSLANLKSDASFLYLPKVCHEAWTQDATHQKAVIDTATTIVHFEERALPIVENLAAQFVPGAAPLMPVIDTAMKKLNVTLDQVLTAKSAAEQAGLFLGLAGEGLRQDLVGFVKVAENGIDIAGKAVDTLPALEAIDPSVFQAVAAKAAASVAVAGKASDFLHQVLDLSTPPARPQEAQPAAAASSLSQPAPAALYLEFARRRKGTNGAGNRLLGRSACRPQELPSRLKAVSRNLPHSTDGHILVTARRPPTFDRRA